MKRGSGLEGALDNYGQLRSKLAAFIKQSEWPRMRSEFDAKFPAAVHLPDTRKADLIIWATGPRSKGLRRLAVQAAATDLHLVYRVKNSGHKSTRSLFSTTREECNY